MFFRNKKKNIERERVEKYLMKQLFNSSAQKKLIKSAAEASTIEQKKLMKEYYDMISA